jgi:hypothetical protein
MKSTLIILLIIIPLFNYSQEDKNWRLFPGKEAKPSNIDSLITQDSIIKKLDFSQNQGNVTIHQHSSIDSLTRKHKNNPYILGYTVQLEVSQQTSKIRDARYRLLKLKPDAPIEENYSAPNTYLYGGSFYTRTDAYEFKNAIRTSFPNAIVIARKLALPTVENK